MTDKINKRYKPEQLQEAISAIEIYCVKKEVEAKEIVKCLFLAGYRIVKIND